MLARDVNIVTIYVRDGIATFQIKASAIIHCRATQVTS